MASRGETSYVLESVARSAAADLGIEIVRLEREETASAVYVEVATRVDATAFMDEVLVGRDVREASRFPLIG
jgi:hypothetical protein